MKYYRNDLILEFCKNKRVLHIGATDSPYHIEKAKENLLLHQKLQTVCSELIGFDKDRSAIKELKTFGINNIFYGDIVKEEYEIDYREYNFDCILFTDVIEHLDNPGAAIKNIKQLMTMNTTLIITMPNVFTWTNIRTFITGKESVHPDHKFWPSYKTAKKIFESNGLVIAYFTYCSYGMYKEVRTINRLIYRLMLKRKKHLMGCMFFKIILKEPS